MTYPSDLRIREVGPRDGIQSQRAPVPTGDKVALIDALSDTGLRYIEAVSFVSPRAVPQMADAREVCARIRKSPRIRYSALVANGRGARAAVDAGVGGLQVFLAATDAYNLNNVRKTVRDSVADVEEVVSVAHGAGTPVEGTVSTAFGCPYEGDVRPERVVEVSSWLVDAGIDAISYGDTTGMGTPRRVVEVTSALHEALPKVDINMHFHDTRGTGLANVLAAMQIGIDYFDASIGGMGGSPFADGATGNIATEDLVHMVEDMGIATGVDLDALLAAARVAQGMVPDKLPSRILAAGPRSSLHPRVASSR